MILQEKTKDALALNTETCSTKKKVYCECDYCHSITLRTKGDILRTRKIVNKDACNNKDCMRQKRQESQLITYGAKNYVETDAFKKQSAQTNKEKYGKESYAQTDECQERIKKTCLKKYGEESYLATDKSKQERKEICLEKYGKEHYSQTQERQEKVKQSYLTNYGVEHYSQTDEYKNQHRKTCLEKYGVDNYSQTEEYKQRTQKTSIDRYGTTHYSKTQEFQERVQKTCMEKFGVPNAYYLVQTPFHKTHDEIKEFLNDLGFTFEPNRKILKGKELDFYNEEQALAIEYCGLYWHTEISKSPRKRDYHWFKFNTCREKGIRLITIFEDEWFHKKECCKNIIESVLGKCSEKVHARKCEIQEIETETCKTFMNHYHLLAASKFSKKAFGLINNNDLVGILSLGKHHRQSHPNQIVLDRLCFKKDIQIVGGASRLFHYAKKWAREQDYKEIVSWSDNRWSSGDVYKVLGFTNDGELGPDYSYVDLKNRTRKSKQSQKKSNTKCPEDKTEREWSLQNGLARIWDCGKIRWKYTI